MVASRQLFIPITRVDRYPHTATPRQWEADEPVERLSLSRLSVDTGVHELGTVTISLSPDDLNDAYGIEVDIEPSSVRTLRRALAAALRECSASKETRNSRP